MPPDSMIKRANEKKVKMWLTKDENGAYRLKTLEEVTKDGLQDKAKVRKMCYDIQSLDDIMTTIPQIRVTKYFIRS